MVMGKQALSTVAGKVVTVEIHGPQIAGYTVKIVDSNGNDVPGMTKSDSLVNGQASVTFTLVTGHYSSKTSFSGRENTVISEDFEVT